MQLSEHFTLDELTRSNTATRLGIANDAPPNIIENLKVVAGHLEVIRDHFGKPLVPSSGYRCPELNKAVGGSPTSAHSHGMACDFTIPGVSNIEVCRWIRDNMPGFDQVIYEFGPKGWVHLGLSRNGWRKQALTAVKESGKTVYKPGIIES